MSTRYYLSLYAHDGNAFARQLKTSPREVVVQVEAWAARERIRGGRLQKGMRYVRSICSGAQGKVQGVEYFDALCWIGNAVMEAIVIPEFDGMSTPFATAYGIDPGAWEYRAPYQLPRAKESPPSAGYLPWTAIEQFEFQEVDEFEQAMADLLPDRVGGLMSELSRQLTGKEIEVPRRPAPTKEQIAYARQEFRHVLETLVEDKLDLLAVLV